MPCYFRYDLQFKYLQIVKIQTIILLVRSCKSQFIQEIPDEQPLQRQHLEVHNDRYQNNYEIYSGPSNYQTFNSNSDEAESCKCSCQSCNYKPTPCCKRVCNNSRAQRQSSAHFQPIPSSLVVVPYPVPFFVYPTENTQYNKKKSEDSTQYTKMKSEESVTNTAKSKPSTKSTTEWLSDDQPFKNFGDDSENSIVHLLNTPFEPGYNKEHMTLSLDPNCSQSGECGHKGPKLQNMRGYYLQGKINRKIKGFKKIRPSVKRVTPIRGLPNYGLIPIPDDMADKLMLQLKNKRTV